MNITEIKQVIKTPEYDFLRKNEYLGDNIILLGLGGSHAYGVNREGSDLDIRGIALNNRKEILLSRDFGQVVSKETDTVIYSFNKMVGLLTKCNPNVIELMYLKPEHYLHVSPEGQMILDNKDMFLSKKAIGSFVGYASQQLYKMYQLVKDQMDDGKLEQHILKTLESIKENFSNNYSPFPEDFMNLYIDKASEKNSKNVATEIFMDVNLSHYPLSDYLKMWKELQLCVSSYDEIGKRNKRALEHGKIAKHMECTLRAYRMLAELLEEGKTSTYRDDHDFFLEIRNGKYVTEDSQIKSEFFDIVYEFEDRVEKAKKNTFLPNEPDYARIEELVCAINESVVLEPYEMGAAERGMEL